MLRGSVRILAQVFGSSVAKGACGTGEAAIDL